MKRNIKIYLLILAIHGCYFLAGLAMARMELSLNLRWLFWNMILALIPMVLALPAYALAAWRKHWGPISLALALAWLLFMPNSCYMITDLIHLQGSELIGGNGVYLQSMAGWIRLIYITAGIFLALVDGLFSTSLIHQAVKWRHIPAFNLLWIAVVSLLCGYGVYIGRFLRLNTWDVLQPKQLLLTLLENIDRFTILFTLLLGAFFFFAYLIFDKVIRVEVKS